MQSRKIDNQYHLLILLFLLIWIIFIKKMHIKIFENVILEFNKNNSEAKHIYTNIVQLCPTGSISGRCVRK